MRKNSSQFDFFAQYKIEMLNVFFFSSRHFICAQCQGVLSYDLTDPSLKWNLTNIEYQHFQHLLNSECSKRAADFICRLLEPECRPTRMKNLKPCRRICKGEVQSMSSYYFVFTKVKRGKTLWPPLKKCKSHENYFKLSSNDSRQYGT